MSDAKIIVAMDFPSIEPARKLAAQLNPKLCKLKIGSTLFTHYGPALVEEWQKLGFDIFLDLKFHDIPATVAGACRAAAELGVWMVNVHASAGPEALAAAREAIDQLPAGKRPLLIAVTVLTSLNENDLINIGVNNSVESQVLRMANLAKTAGLDGVVCSPQEVILLREKMPKNFVLVTPGIRADKSDHDQKRVLSAKAAVAAGSSYLVIGRPITQAANPLQVLEAIAADIQESV